MWIQKRGNKYRAFERLMDYHKGEIRTFSITLEKNTAEARKVAQIALWRLSEDTRPIDSASVTFCRLVELYGEDQERTVSYATWKRNHHTFRQMVKIIGEDTLVCELTAGDIRQAFIRSSKSSCTLNEYLTRLKALLRWAYRNDLIEDASIVSKLKPFADRSKREKIQDKYLEKDELALLLDAIKDTRWKLYAQIMVLTGMRFGEVAALKKSNIDLTSRYIHVVENYNCVVKEIGSPKTIDSVRDIYIQDELLPVLEDAIRLSDTDTLFDYPSVVAFNKYIKEHSPLDKPVTSHVFRHTHTSMLAAAGVPFDTIARRLGHSNSKITREVYFHVTEKLKEKDNDSIRTVALL